MLQNGQMRDFSQQLDQLYVKLFLELNAIETNCFFLQKEGVNNTKLGIKRGPKLCENVNTGVNRAEGPHYVQVCECPHQLCLPYVQRSVHTHTCI